MNLRTGITTGTCAAGAAKACALNLAGLECERVIVSNPEGREFVLETFREGECFGVVKYSGDDRADITDGVRVLARLERLGNLRPRDGEAGRGRSRHGEAGMGNTPLSPLVMGERLRPRDGEAGRGRSSDGEAGWGSLVFCAGEGIGTVTLPGLKLPPGEPAINPVPREMITRAIREVLPGEALRITLSIPGGRELARRTFNPRLGIIGGLSILGTTGIVKPMNEQALLDSLTLELSMIHALSFSEVYITFAGTGEKFTRKLFGVSTRNVIQCGNYPGHVLDECSALGFSHAIICGHPGKLLKVAGGSFCTHSKSSGGTLEALCTQLAILGASPELVRRVYNANTSREAADIVHREGYGLVWGVLAEIVSRKCRERTGGTMRVSAVFIDGEGQVLGGYRDE